jgi:hypothetical protein
MNKPLTIIIALVIATLTVTTTTSYTPTSAESATFKIEGYITNSTGTPIEGAYVIFNNRTVPLGLTNPEGYYSVNAPAGTYLLNVWPPFDSQYINHGETGFVVTSAMTKNITLYTGCKVSGYVLNESSSPMIGASVLFRVSSSEVYGSGWFTNESGYYFANLQPGTYTIDAHPQTAYDPSYSGVCTFFQTYTETNFVVSDEVAKNLTVTTPPATPTPTPNQSSSSSASSSSSSSTTTHTTAKPTAKLPTQTIITIQTEGSFYPGATINITGQISDQNGNALNGKDIELSYALENSTSWIDIGSTVTNASGYYMVTWLTSFSGDSCFLSVKAEYAGDTYYVGACNSTTLGFARDNYVSNSVLSAFDIQSLLARSAIIGAAIIIVVCVVIRKSKHN